MVTRRCQGSNNRPTARADACYGQSVKDNQKQPLDTHRRTRVRRAPGVRSNDAQSRQLQGTAKKVGNAEVGARVGQRNDLQQELLAEVGARLKKIHGVQVIERNEMNNEREWFRQVAKGNTGYHLPDPTRWHACTKVYMQAAQALANGNLGQGARLIEKASQMEESVYATIPKMVADKLKGDEKSASATPEACGEIVSTMTCGRVAMPDEMEFGRLILNVVDVMEDTPPLRARRRRWFEDIEEEEEEEDGENG